MMFVWYDCAGDFMYHISDLKKFVRCPRAWYLDSISEHCPFQPFVRLDERITDLAMEKLGVTDAFIGEKGDDPRRAMDALSSYSWLVKARFEYHDLRIKVPFLHRNEDGWDLYFLYTGIYPHPEDPLFYCATLWVLENIGLTIRNIYIVHLDAEYVRGKQLDADKLFVISDSFYNGKNNTTTKIETHLRKHSRDFDALMERMNSSEGEMMEPVRSQICTGRNRCSHYHTCFKDERKEADNSITHLFCSQHRYAMAKEGLDTLAKADPERIEGSRIQYAQIQADRNGGLFADKAALKTWLSNITYPISFLDFEWERFAVPPYEGMKPYDVLPFEYALYILHEDGTMEHRIYLNVHDDRRNMAENLVRDIPKTGSVVAYNATGAESVRIREFAELYEDLADDLYAINARMEDLQIPFCTGTVYDVRMRGQWSLKVIMSMMNDASYTDLDINQGMEAVYQWRHLDYDDETPAQEKEKIIEDLKKYCGMDAYAMTVVYRWLVSISD